MVTDLFAHDPHLSSGYPMITYTHPIASNNYLPIKTLVASQLHTHTHTHTHSRYMTSIRVHKMHRQMHPS